MNISEFGSRFGFEAIQGDFDDRPVAGGYTSDLLSDVMARAGNDFALITIQAHKNTVAVATLVGICAVVVCNDRPVPEDMTAAAKSEKVAIFRTSKSQFEVSGMLYSTLRPSS